MNTTVSLYAEVYPTSMSRMNTVCLWLAVSCSTLGAIFWCYFNFLTAEDSIVLFNRYNFLEGAPIYFYYAGYWSLLPQTVAFLVSNFDPEIQAVAYSAVALSIFLFLLREVFLASHSGLVTLCLAVLTATFAPFMLYNLTYSFWPGLAILGLVGLRANYQRKSPSFIDVFLCVPGLAGSPLGLLFLPLFVWTAYTKRSLHITAIAILALLSFLVLVERDGGHRSNPLDIVVRSTDQIFQVLSGQVGVLINTSGPGNLVMSILGVLSVLFVTVLAIYWLVRFRAERDAVLLYAAGSLATVLAATGASELPLSDRYWFPIIVCAFVLLGHFVEAAAVQRVRRIADPLVITILCGGLIASSALRAQSWGGLSFANHEWSQLLDPPYHLTALKRSWHEDAAWALGLGKGTISYEECAGLWEHPSSSEVFGFRVYCGNGVFD